MNPSAYGLGFINVAMALLCAPSLSFDDARSERASSAGIVSVLVIFVMIILAALFMFGGRLLVTEGGGRKYKCTVQVM